MTAQSPYVYIVEMAGQPPAVFTWPNVARKFIRDTYTSGGELHLPPADRLQVTRYKVNPKAGQAMIIDRLPVTQFLAAS